MQEQRKPGPSLLSGPLFFLSQAWNEARQWETVETYVLVYTLVYVSYVLKRTPQLPAK